MRATKQRTNAPRRGNLEAALSAAAKALVVVPWMTIGGVAVIARGVKRMTTDVDIAVRGDAISVPALAKRLARCKIVTRIDHAIAFAQQSLVLLVKHVPTGVELDISLAWSGFEHEALARCSPVQFGRTSVPVATCEDLIIYKLLAGRPQDLADVQALTALDPTISVDRIHKRVSELEALLDRAEPAPRSPKKTSARKRIRPTL